MGSAPIQGSGFDEESAHSGRTSAELLRRLTAHHGATRYQMRGEVARGGMGAILKVWDENLRRTLAMKVVLGAEPTETPTIEARQLGRFLEEAQVTAQLDHPGIVPVHELGVGDDGGVYFTMKLVKGRDLKQIFELVFSGQEDWNVTRALSVILRVCEAMAYAHAKGVIHRDLKPANVMVGGFGEVYVMDWGLARVLGHRDAHDLRIQSPSIGPLSSVRTARREAIEEEPDASLVTMDGDVLGTPCYMPPEQAEGEIEKLSPASDVYAIGAMLYHLLTHHMPYVRHGARVSNRTVLAMVVQGPPKRIHEIRRDVPAELVAICEKAMARDPSQRYADTRELAHDLRAYLEHRVVVAYETGAVAELKKWVERNKPLAASLAAAFAILVGGVITSTTFAKRATDKADEAESARGELSVKNVELERAKRDADASAADARRAEQLAQKKSADVLSLSAIQDLSDLLARADELWPAAPSNIDAYEAWLHDATALIEGRQADPVRGSKARPGLAAHQAKLVELEARAVPRSDAGRVPEWTFQDNEDRWWHAQLSALVADITAFADEESGLYSIGTNRDHGWGMMRRLDFASSIVELSVSGADARARWSEAIASIADREQCPMYGGLSLAPQLGLLPIGRDPQSGLWEFAHLASGEPAVRDAAGRLSPREATGLVLVLIPGGEFWMGAQSTDRAAPNFDESASDDEAPVRTVAIAPFFLSKYEMTQGQWSRFAGDNPSAYGPGDWDDDWSAEKRRGDLTSPVEQVSWDDCDRTLRRMGLVLPTEAQWEYAARARSTTPWCTGPDAASLAGSANLADEYARAHDGPTNWTYEAGLDDGFTAHAMVGAYRANPFGLHDVVGNVWEWCRDGYGDYSLPVASVDGERQMPGTKNRVNRGGAYDYAAVFARSSFRYDSAPDYRSSNLGVRPARALEAASPQAASR